MSTENEGQNSTRVTTLALLALIACVGVVWAVGPHTESAEWLAHLAEQKAAREALSQIRQHGLVQKPDGTFLQVIIAREVSDPFMALACWGKKPEHMLVSEFAAAGVKPVPAEEQQAARDRWEHQTECEVP